MVDGGIIEHVTKFIDGKVDSNNQESNCFDNSNMTKLSKQK